MRFFFIYKGGISIDVYLKDNNQTFHFPVNPLERISVDKEKKYTTADVIDFGEIDLNEKGKKITQISFNTLFPAEYNESYCRYIDIPNPNQAIELLKKWKNADYPIRLIITDFSFNELVNIAKFTYEERAGELGDKYISITFRTYRDIKIEYVSENNSNDTTLNNRTDVTTTESNTRYHIVGGNDCLWNLAKKYYGDGSRWEYIYNANKDIIGSDPNLIIDGTRLVIP